MSKSVFDRDRLDVYCFSIVYVASSFKLASDFSGPHRHARDQWLRAAQSVPLNIAEGNRKRRFNDRSRCLDLVRGSALECAAIQDVLAANRRGRHRRLWYCRDNVEANRLDVDSLDRSFRINPRVVNDLRCTRRARVPRC
ncbi:four helix bundle protein [Novipirellula galeiformis]|uniref:four helix bundle protein n=1 Tax=Novipirellula galeiformis TaxID=2528004 RepID=UPI001E370E5C|nr:four helix bundle protein [Novipirellula galeiformis]